LVICDLQMPEMDGVQVIRHLADLSFPGGLILISAMEPSLISSVGRMAQDFQLRVLGTLSKPVETQTLKQLILKLNEPLAQEAEQPEELPTASELRHALRQKQFEAYFQPKVDILQRSVVGVETLARWNHPDKGLLGPEHFIDPMEDLGLLHELTWQIFAQAFVQCRKWLNAQNPLSVSINVSSSVLSRNAFFDDFLGMVKQYNLPADLIMLEVTESTLMQQLSGSVECLARLRMNNFKLSIDDFGTGYSSMQQLERIPFTELKIDKSFVHNAIHDSQKQAIVESSIELAQKLGLKTVAEGVETDADWSFMKKIGCDQSQGYFSGRPMPAEDFATWETQWRTGVEAAPAERLRATLRVPVPALQP
ncbi:MAG: EAL domain-containing response regulator, partial [Pseudomonadales bacterium]